MARTKLTPQERTAKSKAKWASLKSGDAYPQYDPSVEGFGNPDEWIAGFEQRIGIVKPIEKNSIVDAFNSLGLTVDATLDDAKRAFWTLTKAHHPDMNKVVDSDDKIKEIITAYRLIQKHFENS